MTLLRLRPCVAISSCWFDRIKISFCRNAQQVRGYIYTEGKINPSSILGLGLDRSGVRFAASRAPLVPGGSAAARQGAVLPPPPISMPIHATAAPVRASRMQAKFDRGFAIFACWGLW
jgi:hypothetical protein